jgi:GxxExxY protein
MLGAAMEVHRHLGAGFLEPVYEDAFCHELELRGVSFERQKQVIVPYKGILISGQRLDLLGGGQVLVELKDVDAIAPIHEAQLLPYLRAAELPLGYTINCNVPRLTQGIKRMAL